MLSHFTSFIKQNSLFGAADRILLAVSGGIDSVVMAQLFHDAGFRFAVAHCNFRLRGKESDTDEKFVAALAKRLNADCFVKQFDTAGHASKYKISVQMAARELRYAWFEEVRRSEHFDFIATAHHLDDQIETFLINMVRGTGIAGLHGILPKQGRLVRPLMFAFRNDIERYARSANLKFREDSSNSDEKYIRNKIRHSIIPKFEEINPGFRNTLTEEILRIREWESLGRNDIEKTLNLIVSKDCGRTSVDLHALRGLAHSRLYLWEILSDFGFTSGTANDILFGSEIKSGRTFLSASHRAVESRGSLIIERISTQPKQETRLITPKTRSISRPLSLKFSVVDHSKEIRIPAGKEFASLDLDKLEFPLEIRRWRPGDSFKPLGMKGKKKISDFLIDEKVPLPDKDNIWVVCSREKIVWVVGRRIDHAFRINERTKRIYRIEFALHGKP